VHTRRPDTNPRDALRSKAAYPSQRSFAGLRPNRNMTVAAPAWLLDVAYQVSAALPTLPLHIAPGCVPSV
jgi:hypothetical protein